MYFIKTQCALKSGGPAMSYKNPETAHNLRPGSGVSEHSTSKHQLLEQESHPKLKTVSQTEYNTLH